MHIEIILSQLEEWGISLKLDRNGIRFRFWLVFFLLAVGITTFIGILQIGFVRPYYRNSKIRSMNTVADAITQDIIIDGTSESIGHALHTTIDNDVCVQIYNDNGKKVYASDSLGSGCLLNTSSFQEEDYVSSLQKEKSTGEISSFEDNASTGQQMIVYARTIRASLANYYIVVNAPLKPVDSVVSFFYQ